MRAERSKNTSVKVRIRSIVALLLLSGAVTSTSVANTYYVSFSSGSDANSGLSSSAPWKTLPKVNATTFQPGDSILFKSGDSWTGQLKPAGSGNASNPIVIDKYGGTSKPLIAGGGIIGQATLYLNNQQYWEINNLEITNDAVTAGDRRGVLIAASNFGLVQHIYLRNLDIHHVKGIVGQDDAAKRTAGIGIETTSDETVPTRFDDIRIEGCEISQIENTGIYTDNLIKRSDYPRSAEWMNRRFTNVAIRNNVIHDISKNAMIIRLFDKGVIEHNVCYETAQQTTGNTMFTATCDSTVFQYNEGYLNRSTGADGSMYDADLRSPRTIWQYSYSHDNAHGLFWTCTVQADSGVICRYNVSQNDKGIIFCINYPNTSVYCYNNTVYIGPSVSPIIISERNVNTGTRLYHFYNNIIYNQSTSASYIFRTSGYTRYIDYNVFYGNHPSNEPSDAHKLTSDPKFANPGSGGTGLGTVGGYQLQPGSPCINSGVTVPGHSMQDYFGNPVPFGGSVDRGAFERQSSIPTYTISTFAVNGGIAKSPDQAQYDSGSAVYLTALPNAGYRFDQWTGGLSGSENPETLVVTSNVSITAQFTQNQSASFLTWTGGAGDSLWSSAANWNAGHAPTGSDTVLLDHSSVVTDYEIRVTAAGSSCRQLYVGNGTTVIIAGATASLAIGDGIAGNNDITIQTGGKISNLSTAPSGATPFALANSTVDKLYIDNGGMYYHNSTRGFSTPFPAASCNFQPSSTVEYASLSPAQPPMANRVYGNLIFSSTVRKSISVNSASKVIVNGTMTITGDSLSFTGRWTTSDTVIFNAIVHDGDTLSFSSSSSPMMVGDITSSGLVTGTTATSTVALAGNIISNGPFSLGSGQNVIFQGTSMQSISGTGPIVFPNGITMQSPAGVAASVDILVSGGTVSFQSGKMMIDSDNVLSLAPGVSVARTSGHVVGRLRKSIPVGAPQQSFEIGDAASYTPVELSFTGVTTPGTFTASTIGGSHPLLAASGLDTSRKLNRYYAFASEGIVADPTHVTMHFVSGDLDAEANPLAFVAKIVAGGVWSFPAASVPSALSIEAIGVSLWGEMVVGETSSVVTVALSTLTNGHGDITRSPDAASYVPGTIVTLTAIPDSGYTFARWEGDLSGSDNPVAITMNGPKTVTAIFEQTSATIIVTARWNLVSLPIRPIDPRPMSLFPTAQSSAFAYDVGYVIADSLMNGKGYWLKFGIEETLSIGGARYESDSVAVVAGWNLIGAVGLPIAVNDVGESTTGMIVSPLYGFGLTYTSSDTLAPGKGYWVKVNSQGKLFLNASQFKYNNLGTKH